MLLVKHGQAGATSRFTDVDDEEQPVSADSAKELPNDLEALGPTFVKLGQLLSSRADLLPKRYLRPLSRLQDKVKPFRFEDVQDIVEQELGVRINKAFCDFSREPLAAASLGQVHRAKLHDGRPVVVKVQRPNITQQISEDFDALEEIARFLGRHTKFGRKYQLEKVLAEFENTLAHELDYKREAANMEILRENLKKFPRLRVPAPVQDYTTHKILTMEYIDGYKVTDLSPLTRLDIDGQGLAEELFHAYLQQVLVDGVFHADPHPGNIFLTPEHQIVLLDLGMVGHTTPAMQEHLLKLLLAVSEGETDAAADIAIRISETTQRFRESEFRHGLAQVIAEQQNSTLQQIDVGRVLLEVSSVAAESGLYVPTELSLLGKTLLQLDEVGRTLAPNFDPNESIRRNASNILNQRLRATFSEGKLYSSLLEGKQFLGALPSRLNKILDTIGNAEVNVNVKATDTSFLLESAQKVANRITTGLIIAALIVGAALLMQVQTNFTVFGYPGLAIICFLMAAFAGGALVVNILWQDQKSKRKSQG